MSTRGGRGGPDNIGPFSLDDFGEDREEALGQVLYALATFAANKHVDAEAALRSDVQRRLREQQSKTAPERSKKARQLKKT